MDSKTIASRWGRLSAAFRSEAGLTLAEETLKRSEQNLNLSVGRVGTWNWDLVTDALEWSPRAKAMFGLDADVEVTHESFLAAMHPEDRDAADAAIKEALAGKTDCDMEYRAVWPDGTVRWIYDLGRAYEDASGTPVRMAGSMLDITERKLAEETLRRSEQNLNLAVGRVGTWNWDLVTDVLEWSPRAKAMFGLDEHAEVTHASFLAAMHPEDREGADAAIKAALAGKTDCDMEYRAVWPDGTVRWIYDLGRAYEDASGTPVRMAGSMLDITDRKLAEEELRALTDDLVRSNAELEKFAYIASHDLQEPLRMMASYTQLLQRRYKGRLDSDADEFIAYAVDGATRMQTLINDLLAYSRVGTHGSPFASTDLDVVLDGVLRAMGPSIAEAHATVTREHMPLVDCDAVQIGQVFQNLIANAVKFHGEQAPRIHLGVTRSDGEWVFSVKDNGMGIEPAYFDRIFVIFQRLQSRADYPGTGMGLAICKHVIERHGGRIWVESQPGAGSTFYFTLRDGTEAGA
jgi:PAS domain S-box-containing protein